ncbi:S24 family peptidase [Thiohalobacter sp.]|uniref:S24 family peptidase n=1 Tax=Thiohalobacter sp. TaxID=2025948 RepID=UPI0026127096|nr:S24 family peptidase [Thiohalobacter sp.]
MTMSPEEIKELEAAIRADEGSCGGSELIALQVIDDSMEPEFAKGCIIVIDPSGVIQNGSFVIARVGEEEELIFRQLLIQEDRYYLKPMRTSEYETIEIPGLHVIAGLVVQRAGTRRSYHKHYV